jgi:hypothetical protein
MNHGLGLIWQTEDSLLRLTRVTLAVLR